METNRNRGSRSNRHGMNGSINNTEINGNGMVNHDIGVSNSNLSYDGDSLLLS